MGTDLVRQRSADAPARGFGVDAAGLAALCPFHLVWDRRLVAVQVGAGTERLLPGLAMGRGLLDCFRMRQPRNVTTYEQLSAAARRGAMTVLTSIDDPRILLKGQVVLVEGGEHVLFFGGPAVVDEDELLALGLTLSDFPAHSGLADYLLMSRSQRTALAEARALADRLRGLNAELEERVAERTRSLTESRDRLAADALELEELSARLRHESAERERVEADLRLAHKLEAVGQLASGIAHEINTPVQFVGDNLRFLGSAFDELHTVLGAFDTLVGALLDGQDPEVTLSEVARVITAADLPYLREEGPRAVAESLDGIERVGQIVRAMKEFAHPDGTDLAAADLNRAVETTAIVARNEYRHVADLVTDLEPGLPPVQCIAGEINQVLLNLIVNAAHAIGDGVRGTAQRGRITITTRRVSDEVEISIRDTGGGIPVDVQPRIFDPFFTTKEVGRGTGQGLAVCHSIVTVRHGGRLTFTTEPGVGTEFTVHLPLRGADLP